MTGDSVLEISNELLLALERKKNPDNIIDGRLSLYSFTIHKKNKGRLNCWINQHRLVFFPANIISSKGKKKKMGGKEKNKREEKGNKRKKKEQAGKDDVWQV